MGERSRSPTRDLLDFKSLLIGTIDEATSLVLFALLVYRKRPRCLSVALGIAHHLRVQSLPLLMKGYNTPPANHRLKVNLILDNSPPLYTIFSAARLQSGPRSILVFICSGDQSPRCKLRSQGISGGVARSIAMCCKSVWRPLSVSLIYSYVYVYDEYLRVSSKFIYMVYLAWHPAAKKARG